MYPSHTLNSGQQRRSLMARRIRLASFRQIIQYISFLLTEGHNRRQDALNELAAGFTLGAETASPPDDAPAQGPLGSIVGRFNTFLVNKRPQRRFQFEDILAGFPGFPMLYKCADVQQTIDILAKGLHSRLKVTPAQGAISHPIPPGKELLDLFQQKTSHRLGLATSLHKSLKIPLEMGPAHLALIRIQPVVGAIAVRADSAVIIFTQQLLGSLGTTGLKHPEHGHRRGGRYPQPEVTGQLLPTGLIQVDGRLLLNIRLGLLYRLLQSLAHPLFLSRDAAQSNLHMKEARQQLGYVPLAGPKASTQVANRGLQAMTKTSTGHFDRPFSPVLLTTSTTGQGMQLILDHLWFDPGQFADLMALGMGIFSQKQSPTVLTDRWFAHDHPTDLSRGLELTPFTGMPRLATFLPPARFPLGIRTILRGIRGRR